MAEVVFTDDLSFAYSYNALHIGESGGDPLGISNFLASTLTAPPGVRMGVIVMYNPQLHTARVTVKGDQSSWSCKFADESLSYDYGFSMSSPPKEGEVVLIYEVNPHTASGLIIGRVPYNIMFDGSSYEDPDLLHRQSYTCIHTTNDRLLSAYATPMGNANEDSAHAATHFRPTDIYPGEFAYLNQHNCGIKGGLFSSTLIGGGASLRMSALTNAARLTCDSYVRHSLSGNFNEFHNGRYLSTERSVSMYQEERLGGISKEHSVWEDDAADPKRGNLQTIRPRIKEISGYFGNLTSKFCFRPDPDESETRIQTDNPKEEGVSRETIDPSGQYRLSAAGMIAIERTGRIPVPVRICFPSDNKHEIKEDPETLQAFEHDESDPCRRQLELFDRQAYDLKNQYSRIDGLGTENPDYYVPQEEDLEPLTDKYDSHFTKSETVKLNKFDDRRAGVYIGEDGSIILRDAWGSEIVMLGGNITLSCAGNVMTLPGKSHLTIAGDDIVQKAQNSIDIHASEHDVRLSAARNMEIIGGGDESKYSGGVIIESRGNEAQPWDGEDKGESAKLSGITLKAKKQAVVIEGDSIVSRSYTRTRILSGESEMDGEIGIGCERLRARADTIIGSTENASFVLSGNSAAMVADDILIDGGSNASLISGGEVPAPLMWVPLEGYESPSWVSSTDDLADEEEASIGFDSEKLEKMLFGFRTSEECGTTESWTIGGTEPFKLYEPAWIEVMSIYKTLKDNNVDSDVYKEQAEWENGKPWPGEDANDSAKYVQLQGNKPVNLADEGYNKSRNDVQSKSTIEEVKLEDSYLIRKQQ